MNARGIKSEIKRISRQLGFVDVGIAGPGRPSNYEGFVDWIKAGHAGGMAYLASERSLVLRQNPQALMPECQSIILLLARYPSASQIEDCNQSGNQFVSTYARGQDYHVVIGIKLEQLAGLIAVIIGRPVLSRGFTDSAPILERDLAAGAGLGWIGRNSCLISPVHGSFTFIAELLTDLPLEPDVDMTPDYCGKCHRCVDACPTSCILPDRTIAAERCISYLTIENRSQIPLELRTAIGERVFGCDLCQSVCPWNGRKSDELVDERFLAGEHIKNLDLEQELTRTEGDFERVYRNSPILRTRRSGFLRNVALVLGNQGQVHSRKALLAVISHEPDDMVRATAVWAIGQMMDKLTKRELTKLYAIEKNESVRKEFEYIFEQS